MSVAPKFLAAILLAFSLWAQVGQAQDKSPANTGSDPPARTESEQSPEGAQIAISKAGDAPSAPDIFFLPDAAGKLRRVLGYRYEDFLKAWQGQDERHGESDRPTFVIADLSGTLKASGDVVQAKFSITVELQSSAWVQVPLRLASLAVEQANVEGDSDEFVTFDPKLKSFVAWLKGKPGDKRVVKLSGALPISRDGDQKQLELDVSTAAKSSIDIIAPSAVQADESANLVVVSQSQSKDQATTRIDGIKQPVVLRWGPPGSRRTRETSMFEATADMIVNVEPGRLSYDANISVQGFGKPIESIRVELPKGATASVAPESDGATLSMLPPDKKAAGPVAEIRFKEPLEKPPAVRLLVDQSPSETANSATLQATPLVVLDAVRQRGSVAVRISDQLHAHFETHGRIERTEVADLPESLRSRNAFAAFDAAGTNWTLEIHTQRRQRKVRVTPAFNMLLGSQGAQLDVTLDYQIAGGHTYELRIDLHGWELTEQPIESGGAVDLVEQHVTPEQILIMPLKDANAQEVRVKFSLRREAGLGVHELPLPEVLDASVLPGPLTVTTDETWRAAAQIDKSIGVALAPPGAAENTSDSASASQSPGKPKTSLALQTFLPKARLAVEVSEREQLINVHSNVTARLEGQTLKTEQKLEYEILFQPAAELGMTVSKELLGNERLELLLDGKALPPTAVDILPATGGTATPQEGILRLVARMPQPTQGKIVFSIRSVAPLTPAQLSGNARVALPLALPDQAADSTATVMTPAAGQRIALWNGVEADSWKIDRAVQGSSLQNETPAAAFTAASGKPVLELALRIDSPEVSKPGTLAIESAWTQTWVAAGERQDRYVYRLATDAQRLDIALPADFEGDSVEATVDGAVAPAQRSSSGALSVELPAAESRRLLTLELRRRTPQGLATGEQLTASFPVVRGATATAPFVWQLILPPQFLALGAPAGFSAEYRIGWQDSRWGRQPTQTQADLERWTGASSRPAPGTATNQYVFTAFEMPAELEVHLARRLWVVFAGGLAVLSVGLALLYTRLARSAAFWLSLCIAAALLLLTYPEATTVLVQAVIVGGVFTLFSALVRWLLADGERPTAVIGAPAPASSIASLAATQAWAPGDGTDAGRSSASAGSFQASGAAP